MGREILYCSVCGTKLLSDDFTRGRALTMDAMPYCMGCYKPPPLRVAQTDTRRRLAVRRQRVWVGLAAGALALTAVVVVLLIPGRAPADAGGQAVAHARDFAARNPQNVDEALRLWQEAYRLSRTPEAKAEVDRLLMARRTRISSEVAGLESGVRAKTDAGLFGQADLLLEEARKRRGDPSWTEAIAARREEVRRLAQARFEEVRAKAVAAKSAGDEPAVEELLKAAAAWGRPDLLAELERALAGTSLPKADPPPPGATVLLNYPDGPRPGGAIEGRDAGGLLHGNVRAKRATAAFDHGKGLFAVPPRGELRLAYRLGSEASVQIRLRVKIADETKGQYFDLKFKAEGGRWLRFSGDLSDFKGPNGEPLPPAGQVNALIIQTDDQAEPSLELSHVLVFGKP